MNRRTYLAIAFGAWYGLTPINAQQAPFPGAVNVNGGWVPCNHEIAINAGKGCTGNPGYDYPPDIPVQRDVFSPGMYIRQPYPSFRALVISVASDNGRTIVTARVTESMSAPAIGDYIAFDAARTQWFPEGTTRFSLP
jgi:hypothetical protein